MSDACQQWLMFVAVLLCVAVFGWQCIHRDDLLPLLWLVPVYALHLALRLSGKAEDL